MSKYADLWRSVTGPDGRIGWPAEPAERDALARTLFGAGIADAIDWSLAKADDLIDNPVPPEEPWLRKLEDPDARPTLAAMSPVQHAVVRTLVRDAVLNVLFRALVHVDQVPVGEFALRLSDGEGGSIHPAREALHDQLYQWVWDLSAYRDTLMTRTLMPQGGHADQWRVTGNRIDARDDGKR